MYKVMLLEEYVEVEEYADVEVKIYKQDTTETIYLICFPFEAFYYATVNIADEEIVKLYCGANSEFEVELGGREARTAYEILEEKGLLGVQTKRKGG